MNEPLFYNADNVVFVLYRAALNGTISEDQFIILKNIIRHCATPYTFAQLEQMSKEYSEIKNQKGGPA